MLFKSIDRVSLYVQTDACCIRRIPVRSLILVTLDVLKITKSSLLSIESSLVSVHLSWPGVKINAVLLGQGFLKDSVYYSHGALK